MVATIDLAKLYHCKDGTKTINQAIRRHIDRLPDDFYFQLKEIDYRELRSQIWTANRMSKTLPYAFTEQGIAMLATILRANWYEWIFYIKKEVINNE